MKRISRTTRQNFNSLQRSQNTEKIFLAPSVVDVKLRNSKPAYDNDNFIVDWQMEDALKNPKRSREFSF